MPEDEIRFLKALCLIGAALFFMRLMFIIGRWVAWEYQ
jgi:hypothetical protein